MTKPNKSSNLIRVAFEPRGEKRSNLALERTTRPSFPRAPASSRSTVFSWFFFFKLFIDVTHRLHSERVEFFFSPTPVVIRRREAYTSGASGVDKDNSNNNNKNAPESTVFRPMAQLRTR